MLFVGSAAEHEFSVSQPDMDAFIALSGDHSAIHTNEAFARQRGFSGVIVYGGIILAKLSYVLGSKIPGDHGVSTRWTIDYRKPLYVGEVAHIRLEVIATSEATGLVDSKFSVRTGDRLIATGKTQSLVPHDQIGDVMVNAVSGSA